MQWQLVVLLLPITGIVGTEITITDLTEGYTYSVFWDSTLIKQGIVGSNGKVVFSVPASCSGEHAIIVEQPTDTQVLSQSYTVLPNIAIDTITGAVGTNITVVGHGFALNEKNINVTYDGTSMKSAITADEFGTWTANSPIPASVKGKHAIDAFGDTTSTTDVSNKVFTVNPTVTMTPITGGVGTVITVIATGFATSESSIKVLYQAKKSGQALLRRPQAPGILHLQYPVQPGEAI